MFITGQSCCLQIKCSSAVDGLWNILGKQKEGGRNSSIKLFFDFCKQVWKYLFPKMLIEISKFEQYKRIFLYLSKKLQNNIETATIVGVIFLGNLTSYIVHSYIIHTNIGICTHIYSENFLAKL